MSQAPFDDSALYPDTMPGTSTNNMSDGTHDKATEQTYFLTDDSRADGDDPGVKKGEHERDVIPRT